MEYTGYYHAAVAQVLCEAGIYVSVVNPMLVHDCGNNSLRRAKTDKKDAIKLANYALANWLDLPQYVPVKDVRLMTTINLRNYYPFCNSDLFIEVSDEVAAALAEDKQRGQGIAVEYITRKSA